MAQNKNKTKTKTMKNTMKKFMYNALSRFLCFNLC